MSDNRLAQARVEAERRYPGGQRRFTEANLQAAFRQGWLAADENHPAVEALARVRELHRKSTAVRTLPRQLRKDQADGEPHHYCTYCAEVWPCETYEATEVDA